MLIFLIAVGKEDEEGEEGVDQSTPPPHPPPAVTSKALFCIHPATLIQQYSYAFVKDGFINSGVTPIVRRDWICWLIPACLPTHADIHQPDTTPVINYSQTHVSWPLINVCRRYRCMKAASQWRFAAPFAIINGVEPYKPLSRGACPPLLMNHMSQD